MAVAFVAVVREDWQDLPLVKVQLGGCEFSVWGGGIGSLYAVGLAHLGSRYSGPDLASANAAFIMLYALGMLGGPPIAGFGMDSYRLAVENLVNP